MRSVTQNKLFSLSPLSPPLFSPLVSRLFSVSLCLCALLFPASRALAQAFLETVDVTPLQTIEVQDQQTLKTFDTFARQQLSEISGRSTFERQPPVATVLDIAFRPEAWQSRNIVKVKSIPLRQDFKDFPGIDAAEKERILKQGTVSLEFLSRPDVGTFLQNLSAHEVFKAKAVDELFGAAGLLQQLCGSGGGHFLPSNPIPPGVGGDTAWKSSAKIQVNVPEFLASLRASGQAPMAKPFPGYDGKDADIAKVLDTQVDLSDAWRAQNANAASRAAAKLAELLPELNTEAYPSITKRKVEVLYNHLAQLTIPGAFVYFAAFVLFLTGIYSDAPRLKLWGRRMFTLAFVIHTLAIGVRWWLVSHSVGNWFEGIPIKNQFESVLFSSWFGAAIGLTLEYWKGKGIWGAASCFVGWFALVAIFTAPYVADRDIGGQIHQVNGVLMSYWLYIHVTMVTASYALISMSFALGTWWLIKYYFGSGQAADFIGSAKTAALGPTAGGGGAGALAGSGTGPSLELLDQCNMVILQLAVWMLGVGIVLGAVWADQSWGRPWGWDPKETFALVTWIVYLAVVHIRMATKDKAWWTAVLSIVGFGVMMFNWIGVNFFLVGLHSYA